MKKAMLALAIVVVLLSASPASARMVRVRAPRKPARVAVVAPRTYSMIWHRSLQTPWNQIVWSGPTQASYPGTDVFVFRVPVRPYGTVTATQGTVRSVSVSGGYIRVEVVPLHDLVGDSEEVYYATVTF